MKVGERARIALRYTFPSGRGHLSTFLSSLSMLGMVLAIALLIIVLSVMNGFDKEMRERILSLVPNITVFYHQPMTQWQDTARTLATHPQVVEVSPFVESNALVLRGTAIETASLIGLDEQASGATVRLLSSLDGAAANDFRGREDGLVLGAGIARRLGASAGDKLTLVVPPESAGVSAGPAQFRTVHVSAVVETRTELDQVLALVHLSLASQLAGQDGAITGLRLAVRDLFAVAATARELTGMLPPGYYSTHWMMTHGNLYAAIQLSRDLVAILLLSIIAVAAFNVVSSLVLVVLDKQGDIAILRTLGASGRDIAWIFLLQGALIGLVGVVTGAAAGCLGSLAVPQLVAGLEGLLGVQFLDTDVYPVSFVPVELLPADVLMVGLVAFTMSVAAAIYPARRASALAPALVLNQDH